MADLSDIAALPWPRRTARLTLRPVSTGDVEALWRIRRQEPVSRWMTSAATDRDAFIELMADPERMAKTLVVELDGTLIGDLMLAPGDAWAQAEVAEQALGVQAEIGWCLDPAFGGQGYATEAVEELIRIAFEELGIRRLVANAFAANDRSWRLMERVGMRREVHTVAESLHRSGAWMDGVGYGLLATEWRDRRRPAGLGLAAEQSQQA
jgi:RimJ/RimL family protein N-acetyltransferase